MHPFLDRQNLETLATERLWRCEPGWYESVADLVETAADGPVRVIASGDAVWRDLDAHQMEGQELQFSGAIGDDTPFSPPPGGRR